jgi:hypothetical protein
VELSAHTVSAHEEHKIDPEVIKCVRTPLPQGYTSC